MTSAVTISDTDWKRVKIKLMRKYNHLTDGQLKYNAGEEDQLIDRLAGLINRDKDYVIFTLKKALVNIDNNRL